MPKYKFIPLILLGSLTWVLTMWKSGLNYEYGIGFWGPHGHDAVWHLSLINSLTKAHLTLPMYAGESLKNYHFGFDIMTASLVRFTDIPASVWYFQLLPILFSLAIGFLVYKLTHSLWSIYFTYFATGLGWLVTLIRGQGLGGESLFWSQQAISTLINPPFALSLIFLLLGYIYLPKKNYLLIFLFFGLAGFIKIYAGILGLFTLFCVSIYKRDIKLFITFGFSSLLALILFIPFNSLNNQTLIFQPFWFIQNMLSTPDRFYWPRLSSAITNYYLAGNIFKLVPASILALSIFFIGNLGVRVIGFLKIKSPLLPLILLGLIFPIFFVQTGTTWNTIQFFYYAQVFLGLLAGIYMKYNKSLLIKLLILIFTLPAIPATLSQYLPARPPSAIPTSEIQALKLLKDQPSGIVITPLFNKSNFYKFTEPRPIFAYESTAYVSAYSGHPVFLEDEVNLHILNININDRKQTIQTLFTTNNLREAQKIITENHLKYLYLPDISFSLPKLSPLDLGFTNIFNTQNTQIWVNSVE